MSPLSPKMGQTFIKHRFPGASELGRPGTGSNHIMPLFISKPVDGDTTRDPKIDSRVCVCATMLPCRSTTEKCVVQPEFGSVSPVSPMLVRRSA